MAFLPAIFSTPLFSYRCPFPVGLSSDTSTPALNLTLRHCFLHNADVTGQLYHVTLCAVVTKTTDLSCVKWGHAGNKTRFTAQFLFAEDINFMWQTIVLSLLSCINQTSLWSIWTHLVLARACCCVTICQSICQIVRLKSERKISEVNHSRFQHKWNRLM